MTRLHRQSGAALLMTLALLFVVAAAGAALCLRVSETARSNVSDRSRLAARYAAQAGIEKARAALVTDAAYVGETFAFDGFDVVVTVTSPGAGLRSARATAKSATMRAGVAATLQETSGVPAVVSWRDD